MGRRRFAVRARHRLWRRVLQRGWEPVQQLPFEADRGQHGQHGRCRGGPRRGCTACEVVASDDPEARCEGISDTEIEVFIEGESIIFDFSNVTKRGKISQSEFEGYIVSVTEDSRMPRILEAILDATQSTIDSRDLDVQYDDTTVAVNFQGFDHDDATFIKIDLVFDDAP